MTTTNPRALGRTLPLLAALTIALAGCGLVEGRTTSTTPTPTLAPLDAVCAGVNVATCTGGDEMTVITVTASATDADVIELAERLRSAVDATQTSATLRRAAPPEQQLPDASPVDAWSIDVTGATREDLRTDITAILDAARVPGTVSVSIVDGWPYLSFTSVDTFDAGFARVSALPRFSGGATYSLQGFDDRLRIVHVPKRSTDLAIHDVIDIARTYPNAEVLLESTTEGPQWPHLYVSRLTQTEQTELDARLRDPRLAGADVDGLPVGYVLRTLTDSGPLDVSGTFGAVSE